MRVVEIETNSRVKSRGNAVRHRQGRLVRKKVTGALEKVTGVKEVNGTFCNVEKSPRGPGIDRILTDAFATITMGVSVDPTERFGVPHQPG